jgi:hypothetical protein
VSGAVDLNLGFAAAAAATLVTFMVHTFIGGPVVARPLLAAPGLSRASRWLNYYTWHMATAVLLIMTAGFAWAAVRSDAADVAALLMVMAAVSSPLCVWVALRAGVAPWRFPASWLFLIILAAGTGGFLLR